MARMLIISGAILIIAGVLIALSPKIPWLGRLPGDIMVKRENMTFYFPWVTCLLLSLILSIIMYVFNQR